MGTKKLAKPIKGVSIVDIIKDIEKGKENYVPFPIEKTNYLRSKCSGLKWEFPDRKYTVNEVSKEKEARVSWVSISELMKEENTHD